MIASDLNQLLEEDLAAYNVVVQASQQDECLHVVLNRSAATHLDYDTIAKLITSRIKTSPLGEIHSLFLFSRVLGEYDLDWQTQFEFVSPSFVEQAVPQNVDSTETEDSENKTAPLTDEPNFEETEPISTPEVEKSPFANYCFISNKSLLTFQILPPDEMVCKLIQFFHNVPDSSKANILPLLEIFFASSVVSSTEQFDEEVQQWFEQLTQLDKAQIRKASIWFSRYCFNPEKTMMEVMVIIEPEPVKIDSPQEITKIEAEIPKVFTTNVVRKSPTQKNVSKTKTANIHPLALPIGWFIFTLIIIAFSIGSYDSAKITAAACKNTVGKSEYCKLAVKLVGEVTFQQASQYYKSPMTPAMKTQSLDSCEIQGTIYAGKGLKESMERKNPVVSSYGEEILPGIFIGDVKQTNFKQAGEIVRIGCVMANTGKRAAILGSAIIPTNWPEQPFEGKPVSQESFRKTLGIFNILLLLGAGTLFNAVGIFLASVWGLGIRVSSLETIYKVAFFLGILETMISLLPVFGVFGKIALETLALGIISLVVKDFHVEWSSGSKIVAAGAITIIVVSFFLKIMLFSMMAALVH